MGIFMAILGMAKMTQNGLNWPFLTYWAIMAIPNMAMNMGVMGVFGKCR